MVGDGIEVSGGALGIGIAELHLQEVAVEIGTQRQLGAQTVGLGARRGRVKPVCGPWCERFRRWGPLESELLANGTADGATLDDLSPLGRSEEHTSELQSRFGIS